MRERAGIAVVLGVALGAGVVGSRSIEVRAQQSPGMANGSAQTPGGLPFPTPQSTRQNPAIEPPPLDEKIEAGQRRARGLERQKKMVADSQRMVALASEVNAAAGDHGNGQVPDDVVKKIAEIEKLAHGVKDRMKGQ